MTIYVDDLRHVGKREWCHMASPDLRELHFMARKIGLKREWFQDERLPHYDLVKSKREQAILAGARAVNSRMLLKECFR